MWRVCSVKCGEFVRRNVASLFGEMWRVRSVKCGEMRFGSRGLC